MMGTEGWLKGQQRITLDNVLGVVIPECRSIRIKGFLAQDQTTERRNDGSGIQATERRPGVRVVRVRRGGKMVEDLVQMTECSIVPAFGEQGKFRLLEKVFMAEMPVPQDNPGGETLKILKVVGQGSV